MRDFLHAIGIEVTTTVAGIVGGVLSIVFVEHTGIVGKITSISGGWACAHFITPLVRSYFGIEGAGGGIAFLLGLFGMLIVSAIVNAIKTIDLGELVKAWLKKFTGTP